NDPGHPVHDYLEYFERLVLDVAQANRPRDGRAYQREEDEHASADQDCLAGLLAELREGLRRVNHGRNWALASAPSARRAASVGQAVLAEGPAAVLAGRQRIGLAVVETFHRRLTGSRRLLRLPCDRRTASRCRRSAGASGRRSIRDDAGARRGP